MLDVTVLFIITAEILANFLRRDENIKGFKTNAIEQKLSQFADDTTLILDGSEHSFLLAIEVLDGFHEISGIKVSYEKTKMFWIGSGKGTGPLPCNKPDISWVGGKKIALGVWFAPDRNVMILSNYDEKIAKIKNIIQSWQAHFIRQNPSYQKPSVLPANLHFNSTPNLRRVFKVY